MAEAAKTKGQKLIRTCSIWRSLEVVGDTAISLILESIFWRERRFEQIRTRTGLPKPLISNRLKRLIEADILEKRFYRANSTRTEYALTEKGRDLLWVSLMSLRWDVKWSGAHVDVDPQLTHTSCGKVTMPEPLCGHCKQVINAKDVTWEEGPGVGWMAPVYQRRRQLKINGKPLSSNRSLFTEVAEITGDRWSSLILRSMFTGLRKYDEILHDTAIASNILVDRLNWLTEKGVITSVLYQNRPNRFEYWLTKKGLDYYPVLVMLQKWGDKYYASPEGPPVILIHKTCGQPLNAFVGCSHCLEPIRPREMMIKLVEKRRK